MRREECSELLCLLGCYRVVVTCLIELRQVMRNSLSKLTKLSRGSVCNCATWPDLLCQKWYSENIPCLPHVNNTCIIICLNKSNKLLLQLLGVHLGRHMTETSVFKKFAAIFTNYMGQHNYFVLVLALNQQFVSFLDTCIFLSRLFIFHNPTDSSVTVWLKWTCP